MNLKRKHAIAGILTLIVIVLTVLTTSQADQLVSEEIYSYTNQKDISRNIGYQIDSYNISQWQTFFDNEIAGVMNNWNIPGMALSVVNSTDVLHNKGYGYADLDSAKPVDPNTTIFRLGSVSKIFTWTSVMQLYEQGLLDLDEDVNNYLTTFKIKNKFGMPITMKHLMSHSAGFAADWMFNGEATEDTILSLKEYVIKFQPKRVLPPGEICSYSNYGAGLAAYIVSQISNTDFETYTEQNIFNPLKMNSSTFRQPFPENLKDNYTSVYSFDEEGNPTKSYSEYVLNPPAGGLSTTALDAAQFMMAHLNNGSLESTQLLQETTTQLMHQRLHDNDPRITGWAYGFIENNYRNHRILSHAGAVARSGGVIYLLKELDIGIFMSYNCKPLLSTCTILTHFLDTFFPSDPVRILFPTTDFKEQGKRFEGKYHQVEIWEETPQKIERVVDNVEVRITESGYLLFRGLLYVEVEDLLFRVHNELSFLAFRENSNGEITYLFQSSFFEVAFTKLDGMSNPTRIWVHMISCLSLLLLVGLEYVLQSIRRRVKKNNEDLITTETRIQKITYRLAIIPSIAYILQTGIVFLFLFNDTVSLKQRITLLNVSIFIPIFIIPFSCILFGLTIYSWIKRKGTLKTRIIATFTLVITSFHLWFIFFWNFVGFLFNYGVWIPY